MNMQLSVQLGIRETGGVLEGAVYTREGTLSMQERACIVQGRRTLGAKDVRSVVQDLRMLQVMVALSPLLDSSKEEVVKRVAKPLHTMFPGMQAIAASQQNSVQAAREKHCLDHPASIPALPKEHLTGSMLGVVHICLMTCESERMVGAK